MQPRAVIFDFDFTLGDSSNAIVDCVNTALAALGRPAAAPAAVRRTIGLPLEQMYEILARDGPAPAAFRRLFVARADQIMVDGTSMYPGVPDALADLSARGARLGIVTTKHSRRIAAILARAGLEESFPVVVGSDSVSAPKPDPEGLILALGRLAVAPGEALYVGDSPTDAATAQRAGVPFVAVLSGVTPAAEFAAHPHLAMLPGVAALPAWLAGGASGRP